MLPNRQDFCDIRSLKKAFLAAFPYTIPIMTGFLFLGIAYGFYMHQLGFSAWYPLAMSALIFAGSAEFIVASMLLLPFAPLQTFLVVLLVNARHLFYGISMLGRFRGTGRMKPYLIFGMCDESFSINCSVTIPDGVDRAWFMFFVTLLNQSYWVVGATLGSLFGSCISIQLKGLDFVMNTLFIVIFLEHFRKERNIVAAAAGFVIPIASLLVFGKTNFILPAMALIIAALLFFRRKLEKEP